MCAEIGYAVNPEVDAAGHKGAFAVVDPGWKKVVIIESKVELTKAGQQMVDAVDGVKEKKKAWAQADKMLIFIYELQDGTNRTLTDRLNTQNKSEIAQRIGRGALGKIKIATGHKGELLRTEPLHGRPFEVLVAVESKPDKKGEIDTATGKVKEFKNNSVTDYRAVQAKTAAPTSEPKAPAAW